MMIMALLLLTLLVAVLALCAWTKPTSPLPLRWLRGKLWFIRVARWRAWVDVVRVTGWRFGIFRNYGVPRSKEYGRRWGGYLLGLSIGNRGGTRRNVRHEMRLDPCPNAPFGPGGGCWMCQRQAPPAPGPAVALPTGLKHVRDLEAFDGPLLSEFTCASGAVWVLKWAARGDEAHRWLMVRSTRESIACYLAGIFSMCDLLAAEGDAAMLVDYDGDQPRGAWSVSLSDPKVRPYLPERDVMHDPELRPEPVADAKPICKLRINGGNGNPANAGRECACEGPRECPIGISPRPAGPEQDITTGRFRRLERA
jgi:hypothetical protein